MKRVLTSLAVAMMAASGAAHAQETGSMRADTSPIVVEEGSVTGDAARAVYDSFALCIVKRHYLQVRKALDAPFSFQNDMQSLPKLMDKECFFGSSAVGRAGGTESIQLTTNPISFRGALYKALVIKDFARKPIPFGPTAPALAGDNKDVLRFAGCVARLDPAASLNLIRARAGSAGEKAAVDGLTPHLSQCSAQRRMSLSKGILVGFLAEAYYREADASKTSSH